MTEAERYRVDKAKLRQAFERASASYDEAAVLQHEVGDRMLERLSMIKVQPKVVLDGRQNEHREAQGAPGPGSGAHAALPEGADGVLGYGREYVKEDPQARALVATASTGLR